MEKIDRTPTPLTFNGALESGVRAVLALYACYPAGLDLQRITAMDYLMVRTSLLDGPSDLHPGTPVMTPVTQVRRKTVQDGLHLMMSRDLVSQSATSHGIYFTAGDNSALFVDCLQSFYLQQLKERAEWLTSYFQSYNDEDFDGLMRDLLTNWISEFQDESVSAGALQ